MEVLAPFAKYILPALSGAIAGFFSPWFKFWFESLSDRRSERRALIASWETDLLDPNFYFDFTAEQQARAGSVSVQSEYGVVSPDEAVRRLTRSATFATLAPYLSSSARAELGKFKQDRTIYIIDNAMDSCIRAVISREIQQIKKSWKLV